MPLDRPRLAFLAPLALALLAACTASPAGAAGAGFRRDDLGARRHLPVLRVNGIDLDRRAVDRALQDGEITWTILRERFEEQDLLKDKLTKQEFIISTDVAEPGIVRKRLGEQQSAEHERRAWEAYRKATAGADWDALVREYSTEPGSSGNGGDIGTVAFTNLAHPYNRAMFTAEPGVVVPPVQTVFGWHVGKVTEIIPARDVTRPDGSTGRRPEMRHIKQILIIWDIGLTAEGMEGDLRFEIPEMMKGITYEVLDPSACDEFPHWCGRTAMGDGRPSAESAACR